MVIAIRGVAAVFAVLWAVLGFGIVDLWVTVSPSPQWRPVALLDGGWGLFVTLLIAAGLALVAIRPRWANEIAAQLLAVAALIVISGLLGQELAVWWMVLALVVPAGLLMGLASVHGRHGIRSDAVAASQRDRPWVLGGLAALGCVPWLIYAADMYAANRELRWPTEITNDVNHWAIQGAFAVALVGFAGVAALRPALRRFNAVRVGICAAYLGICSLRFPGVAAALPTVWAVLAIVWGAAIAIVALARRSPAGAST